MRKDLIDFVNTKLNLLDHNAVCFLLEHYEEARNLITAGNESSENDWNYYVGLGNKIYVEEPCYMVFEEGDVVYYERKEIISYDKYRKDLYEELIYLNNNNQMIEFLTLLEAVILALSSDIEYKITDAAEECYRRKC